jgi:hypothetical protein
MPSTPPSRACQVPLRPVQELLPTRTISLRTGPRISAASGEVRSLVPRARAVTRVLPSAPMGGLLYLALALVGVTLSHILVPAGSTITADRAREAQAGQAWDKRLLKAYFFTNAVTFLIAGMNSGRFGWTPNVPMSVTAAGVGLMLLGQVLFAEAKRDTQQAPARVVLRGMSWVPFERL